MSIQDLFPKIISHCKEHGFVFQSSEIYDGLSAVYDYGPLGSQMKKNISDLWMNCMTRLNTNIFPLDSAILMHPDVWKASGHIDAFNDPLIDNKDSRKRYRADVLIEDYLDKLDAKSFKETEKKAGKEGWTTDSDEYLNFLKGNRDAKKAAETRVRFSKALEGNDLNELRQIIVDAEIADPETGSKNWTEVRQFNLMFKTRLGSVTEDAMDLYLRPETAQGIFVNFLNVQKTARGKIPFGIAQVGKAFRNEIVARQFIFRMREFEQMEMQFFVKPGTQKEWFEYWKAKRMQWHRILNLPESSLQFHLHEKLAHYADDAVDIQFEFPFGFKELEGIHSRTDFDLGRHQELSGKKLQYFDPEENQNYIPYVIETSVGLDRTFLAHLCHSYREEMAPTGSGGEEIRTVLSLHPLIAPVQIAVLPLIKKDGLPEFANNLMNDLKFDYKLTYDEKDAVGRRYRRQDAKGTPYCITVDHDSLTDQCVTVRERDTMVQERIPVNALNDYFRPKFSLKTYFSE